MVVAVALVVVVLTPKPFYCGLSVAAVVVAVALVVVVLATVLTTVEGMVPLVVVVASVDIGPNSIGMSTVAIEMEMA